MENIRALCVYSLGCVTIVGHTCDAPPHGWAQIPVSSHYFNKLITFLIN